VLRARKLDIHPGLFFQHPCVQGLLRLWSIDSRIGFQEVLSVLRPHTDRADLQLIQTSDPACLAKVSLSPYAEVIIVPMPNNNFMRSGDLHPFPLVSCVVCVCVTMCEWQCVWEYGYVCECV
jgi:hypothetical protein